MTDQTSDSAPPASEPIHPAAEPAEPNAPADDLTADRNPANKAFWTGIGVGSAALVAALMYASRSRRKK